MKIYQRYIGSTLLHTILLVLLVLTGLELLISFIGELNDIGTGDYNLLQAVEYVLLDMPRHVYMLFPMSALVGVLMGLGLLAASSELIVLRAAGVSLTQIALTVMIVALSTVLVVSIMGETVGPHLKRVADERKATQISGGQALKTRHGTWIRDGQSFIHIETILPGERLQGITRYAFNEDGQLKLVSFAKQGSYKNGVWLLHDVEESQIEETHVTAVHHNEVSLQMSLSPRLLRISQVEPEDMSLSQLHTYILYREQNGLRASNYDLAFFPLTFFNTKNTTCPGLCLCFYRGTIRFFFFLFFLNII